MELDHFNQTSQKRHNRGRRGRRGAVSATTGGFASFNDRTDPMDLDRFGPWDVFAAAMENGDIQTLNQLMAFNSSTLVTDHEYIGEQVRSTTQNFDEELQDVPCICQLKRTP